MMDQMITMITKLNLPTHRHTMAMCKAVKSEVIFMGLLVQDREPGTFTVRAPRNIKGVHSICIYHFESELLKNVSHVTTYLLQY